MPVRAAGVVGTRAVVVFAIALGVVAGATVLPHAGTMLVVSRPIDSPGAIVSLASHEWERLPETAALAARFPASSVLLTLPQRVTEFNCHDCAQRVAWLKRAGVDPARIQVLALSQGGTYGEAMATLAAARRLSIHRLVIVTSPYHTRRALATFQTVFQGSGVDIGVVPASQTSPARPGDWWWTPYDRWYVRYEWSASLYYLLRYGVNSWAGA